MTNIWTLCDRCGFKYRRRAVRKERGTSFVVCPECHDGAYDLQSHPQNRPPPFKAEMVPVPDARPDDDFFPLLAAESSAYLLTEDSETIVAVPDLWTSPI